MKEGAETVHTKIQAKAESVLKHGLENSKGKLFDGVRGFILIHIKNKQIIT